MKSKPSVTASPAVARTFAYLRISTAAQDTDSQKLGIVDYAAKQSLPIARWFEETASGKVFAQERVLGRAVIPALQPGDTLIVAELSRLGRSLVDILNTLKAS